MTTAHRPLKFTAHATIDVEDFTRISEELRNAFVQALKIAGPARPVALAPSPPAPAPPPRPSPPVREPIPIKPAPMSQEFGRRFWNSGRVLRIDQDRRRGAMAGDRASAVGAYFFLRAPGWRSPPRLPAGS